MRKSLLASIAVLAALSITTADAADKKKAKPVAAAAPPVIAAAKKHNWTGVYAGMNAGAAWNSTSTKFEYSAEINQNVAPRILPGKLISHKSGFTGGAQIGYNHQIDQYVFGLEIDFQNIGKNKKAFSSNGHHANGDPNLITTSVNSGAEWLGTSRLRAGYTFDEILVYATGGLAFGSAKNVVIVDGVSTPVYANDGKYFTASKSETKWGWALGIGTEYAVTKNISIKAEYLHYDLGASKASYNPTELAVQAGFTNIRQGTSKIKIDGDIIRIGLNYKF